MSSIICYVLMWFGLIMFLVGLEIRLNSLESNKLTIAKDESVETATFVMNGDYLRLEKDKSVCNFLILKKMGIDGK
jgi:hypothetical protein